ncbi:hypothetical protein ACFO0N_14320 [Halobium salinum]|uniref:DUF8124 domain-containing protein n=1 Tax=Halobium salinum TaxID=1364940 RepID=A0ABD5PE05_9EURY|nr:hypothetical protein [Halobium salinum]
MTVDDGDRSTGVSDDRSGRADADSAATDTVDADGAGADDLERAEADTFGVGVHVTDEELRFVVRVPSDIDSGWTDPEAFQELVERVVWERLDRETVLRRVAAETPAGETVTLGTVTLQPDGTVVDYRLSAPTDG